jgi:hypothetical protein
VPAATSGRRRPSAACPDAPEAALDGETQPATVVVVVEGATLALPNTATAPLEMRKPSPLASVHFTPAGDDEQVNGLSVIDMP